MVVIEEKTGKRVRIMQRNDKNTFYRYIGDDTTYTMRNSIFQKLYRLPIEGESFKQLNEDELWAYGMQRLKRRLEEIKIAKMQRRDYINEEIARQIDRREALVDDRITITHNIDITKALIIYYNINNTYNYKMVVRKNASIRNSELSDKYETLFKDIGVEKASTYIAEKLNLNQEALFYMMIQIKRIEMKNNRDKLIPSKHVPTKEEIEFEKLKKQKAEEYDRQLAKELKEMKKESKKYY